MFKTTLVATLAGLALFSPVAFAQEPVTCDEATITAMESEMYKMADPKAKQEAMEALIIAKSALKDNKQDECLKRMQEAASAMRKT